MREFTKNGVVYLVHPLTHGRLLMAAKTLRKAGVVLKPSDEALDSSLEFQAAVCKAVTSEIREAGRTLNPKEVDAHFLDTPGAMDFVLRKANEMAEESRLAYKEEEGNS